MRSLAVGVAATIAPLLYFKYYGFFAVNVDERRRGPRARARAAAVRGRPAGRRLLLHVHGDRLRRRRLPARHRGRDAGSTCSCTWRSSRTWSPGRSCARRADPAARRAARRAPRGRRRAPMWLILGGLFKKVVIANFLATAIVDPVFGDPARLSAPEAIVGARRLRRADLLRLQRVHRHRDRHREAARVPVPAELRPALRAPLGPGVLAPLAHDALALAARLPVHPARREPQGHRRAPTST